jgi:hypothetical protein
VKISNHRQRRLLRARRERSRRRTTEQRYELAAFQLIELHSVPHQPGPDCKISNWRRGDLDGRISLEVTGRFNDLFAAASRCFGQVVSA